MPIEFEYDWNDWNIASSNTITATGTGGGGGGGLRWHYLNTSTSTLQLYRPGWETTWTSGTTYGGRDYDVIEWDTYGAVRADLPNDPYHVPPETEARRAQIATERAQFATDRTVANNRAEELLLMLLDENQREAFRQDRVFTLIGSHGTLYRIRFGHSGNVDWLKPDGSLGGRLCAHPTMRESWLPTADVVLSQVLALKTDEREFCRVANVHLGSRPPRLVAA